MIKGILLILIGAVFGIYVGGWLMFVGGIMNLLDAAIFIFKTSQIPEVTLIGKGIFKLLFSGIVGWISFFVFAIPGVVLIEK